MKNILARLQGDFFAGFAVVLPAIVSFAILLFFFGTVANITDKLLFLVPRDWKYVNGVRGEIYWYWSLVALVLAIAFIAAIGRFTRYYIGRKLIQTGENLLLRVPLISKIYITVKQVKEAFSGNKSSFKQAVLVEFPRPGVYSLGFVTGEQHQEVQAKTPHKVWSVFIPTTPNPTTGFLIFIPESQIIKLEMTVADAIKNIISLGSVAPEYLSMPKADGAPSPEI